MDAFTEFELDLSAIEGFPTLITSSDHRDADKDIMCELIDADTRVGFGGYCVVS